MTVIKTPEGLYEVSIGEEKYQFVKWNAEEALDVLLDIVPLVGKPLGAAASAFAGGGDSILDKDVDPNAIGAIIESLTSNFNKSTVKSIIIKLCSDQVMCDGKVVKFKSHYTDRMGLVFKVCQANLEVQYGNFFDAIRDLLPAARMAPAVRNAQAEM